jgi:homoserine O-acetyltransferase
MDVAVPMASLPTEMSGRNWMMRRLIIDSIRSDPEWMNGNYTKQPRSAQFASIFYGIGTNGGNHALFLAAPTRDKADQLLDARLKAPFPAMRTTCCTNGTLPGTTIRRQAWSASGRR